jgi:ComF family protein
LQGIFPEVCRVCEVPLRTFSRVPVCPACLASCESFLPEFFCRRCRMPFANRFPLDEEGVCRLCRTGGNRFDAAYTFGAYDGALRRLIHLLKFDGVQSLAGPLARRLAEALPRQEEFDRIVPVPLHWSRRFSRGFNQAELLASELSERTGIPVAFALRRRRRTDSQSRLTASQRRRNMAGSIRLRRLRNVAGLRILLVDDVLTTGATMNACAAALKRAGAARVTVLTVARADRRADSRPADSSPRRATTQQTQELPPCRE